MFYIVAKLQALDFVKYFEEVHIGRLNRIGSTQKPRCYLILYNVYHCTIEHLPRTNNAIEGINRGFEAII